MKKLAILFFFVPYLVCGQINDDFESGSLTGWESFYPERWAADTTDAISGEYSLRHIFDNSYAGTDYIGREIKNLHPDEGPTAWSFKIKYNYNPSASNNWSVWLISDSSPTSFVENTDARSGFALGVNLSSSDDTLRLWSIENGNKTVVANSGVNWEKDIGTNSVASINVERDVEGTWNLSVDTPGGTVFSSGTGDRMAGAGWFVIEYRYTKTGDMLLWMDDISLNGVFYADTVAPRIDTVIVTDRNRLVVSFSEPVDWNCFLSENIFIGVNDNSVGSTVFLAPQSVELTFHKEFLNKSINTLEIGNITDRAGNRASLLRYDIFPVWAELADVIITEIMADPSPPVGLPEAEYIEIYNASEYNFNLYGWKVYINKNGVNLPDKVLKSGQYSIMCHNNQTTLLADYGDVIGLTGFPAVPNDGGTILLLDNHGNLIHGVDYSADHYNSNLKLSGGWSLEMIDTDYPFHDNNWSASNSPTGGTPGFANSISSSNPDNYFIGLTNVFPTDTKTIAISFSEPVLKMETIGYLVCGELTFSAITPTDSLRKNYIATLTGDLEPGKTYNLSLSDKVVDFAGNMATRYGFTFGLTFPAERGDLVFNELLFNPFIDEPDFLEFYNIAEHPLDLSRLKLASINTDNGDTSKVVLLYPSQICLMPGSYFVVTTDPAKLVNRYPESDPERIFKVPSLPSMPDKKGHLLLLTDRLELIDEVIYTDKMHFSLLAETEGISLEKIRPNLPSNKSSSWHSAAESVGFATPGRVNSVYGEGISEQEEIVKLSSTRITPDNDGYEDILELSFSLPTIGNVVSVSIYSETGKLVHRLTNNITMEDGAVIFWDGTIMNGGLATNGIYIIHIEILSGNGRRTDIKKVCTVIRN